MSTPCTCCVRIYRRRFRSANTKTESAPAGLVRWASEHGCSEMGMQRSLLPAPSAQLRRTPLTVDPRLRSRRRHAVERVLDWANFVTRGSIASLADRRRDEIVRIAGESMVRYRAGRLDAMVLLIRPDKDANGLPDRAT